MEPSEKLTEFKRMDSIFTEQKNTSLRLRQSTVAERIHKLNLLKKWIRDNMEVISNAIKKDLGKPRPEADITEIYVVLSDIKFACKGLAKWVKPRPVKIHWPLIGSRSYIQYEPKGCALIIAPWNYPFNLAIGPLVSAIAAGCTAMIKPSEMAPHTSSMIAAMIAELFREDEVAVVEGGKETAEKLLSPPL
jgi:aldehyde dehydrogenase (NAD+)